MFARAYAQIASFDPVFKALQRSNSPEFAKINKVLEGVVLIPRSCVFSHIADTYLSVIEEKWSILTPKEGRTMGRPRHLLIGKQCICP